jgi:hypothetical protein
VEPIDLKKRHKELYRASESPSRVHAPDSSYLMVEGTGRPGDETYQRAIEKLYGVAYTMKFALKGAGTLDFKVPNLECLWLSDPAEVSIDDWQWRLLIRIPDEITEAYVQAACSSLHEKKGVDASEVRLGRWEEGPAVQIRYVGPYDGIAEAYDTLTEFAEAEGLPLEPIGHEVYLSDPRRTAPEKLQTIIRIPIASESPN